MDTGKGRILRLLIVAFIITGALLLGFLSVQARRFLAVDGSNNFDLVRVCTDGMEIGFARQNDNLSVTGAWWAQPSSVQLVGPFLHTLPFNPVVINGTTYDHSEYLTILWENNIVLQPGHRIRLRLNETQSQPIWGTVEDCVVDDGVVAAEWFVYPDVSQDDNNGGALTGSSTTFTMSVPLTRTVGSVNVAMFIEGTSTLTLTTSLMSPNGTTVQLMNQATDNGQDFGFRCRKQNQQLIGDPMADLVFDDVSLFNLLTPGIFNPFEMLYAVNPEQPLSALQGESPTGIWSLQIDNLTPAVSADLRCWMLQFYVDPPQSSFNKLSPTDGATFQPTSLTLDWSDSAETFGYEYCYDTSDDDNCSGWISTGTSSSASISGLTTSTTYYWQVRASNVSGVTYANGSATTYWSFTTEANTPTATATSTPVPPTDTPTNTPVGPTSTPTPTNTPGGPTPTATATGGPEVFVADVYSADNSNVPKTQFEPGEPIHWIIVLNNVSAANQTVTVNYSIMLPNGQQQNLFNGPVNAGPGLSGWFVAGTATVGNNGTHTFTGSATFNSIMTSDSSTYEVDWLYDNFVHLPVVRGDD